MSQINLIELLQESESFSEVLPFDLHQKVEVKVPHETCCDPEDYYYLLDFKKKRGSITEIHQGKLLSYTVNFGNIEGIFYHDDLIAI